MEQTEQTLWARYKKGELEAFEALVRQYRPRLYAYILSMVGNRADADDVYQELWLKTIKYSDSFDGRKLQSWLFTIAHNLIIDRRRKDRQMASLDEQRDNESTLLDSLADVGAKDPFDALLNKETAELLNGAIAMLPAEQREVFLLRTQSDMPFKQIARLQRTSINTALARMQYALAKIREAVKTRISSAGAVTT